MGHYKIIPESFRIFFYEHTMKRVNIYQISLKNKKIEGPQYLNIDFIQRKLDDLNSMINVNQSEAEDTGKTQKRDSAKSPLATDFESLLKLYKQNKKQEDLQSKFQVRLMRLHNFYYNSEILLVFDGFNIYKYVEDIKNK